MERYTLWRRRGYGSKKGKKTCPRKKKSPTPVQLRNASVSGQMRWPPQDCRLTVRWSKTGSAQRNTKGRSGCRTCWGRTLKIKIVAGKPSSLFLFDRKSKDEDCFVKGGDSDEDTMWSILERLCV